MRAPRSVGARPGADRERMRHRELPVKVRGVPDDPRL
jgi:hypothetical protein